MSKESDEFDSFHRIKGALYPYDDKKRENCEPQWTKLKAALSDNNITNIAITSSYDTGKTSFLKSFFKMEYPLSKWESIKSFFGRSGIKYKFITVPTFSGKGLDIKEEDLEKNIINQLLFSEEPRKFPDSRINRIYPYCNCWIWFIWILLWIWGTLIFWITPVWNEFWSHNPWKIWGIIAISLFISWWVIYYVVHNFYKLSWNAKANFGPVELSGANTNNDNGKSDHDLFILYGDEIKYYFKRSNIRFVILEDMDRFNSIEIFQKLRELNKNINESQWLKKKNKRVIFIYTLSDSIFQNEGQEDREKNLINENKAAESKAKFFDYVLALMPFSNLNSSKDIFDKEIEKYDELIDTPISNNVLLGVSFYISDKREITCIIADMDTYLRSLDRIQGKLESRLEEEPNFIDKLFAAMVYKNVYPEDFDNLSKGKSNLGYVLQEIGIIKGIVENDDELKGYELIQYNNDKSIANLLSIVWNNYDEVTSNNKVNGKFLKVLDYIRNLDVLRFLLSENLIGEDIYEFLSPTQFEGLSPDQILFIRNAMARRRSNADFVIDDEKNRSEILDLLKAIKVDFNYVYSSSILEELIQRDDEDRTMQMMKGMAEIGNDITDKKLKERLVESKEEFIDRVINWLYTYESKIGENGFMLLAWSLYESWNGYFVNVLKNNKYRGNAIRFVLNCIAIDGEIGVDDDNLIAYLIDKKVIGKYEEAVEYSKLSEKDKKHVLNEIKREKEK